MSPYPNAVPDFIDVCNLGMHSGASPEILPDNQVWFGCNMTFRGGHPATRPPIRKLATVYEEDINGSIETIATEGLFQCASFYEAIGENPNCLISSISGRIFRYRINNNTATVQHITPLLPDGITFDVNDPTLPKAWMFQGEEFLVINDGQSNPYFFDGASVRRSAGSAGQELPPSCMGAYINRRFIVVLPDRRSYIAGDLVYTVSSGTAPYNYRDSILRTTENAEILAGRAFSIPMNAGSINAVFAVAIPDTSLGQGPIQIGTRKGIFGVNLPLDANLWTTTQQPSSVVSLPSSGPTSHECVSLVNGDAWYRGQQGIYSFAVARRDFNTWVQTPLSFEMDAILPFDTHSQLSHCSSVEFDNRLLMTCSPHRVSGRGIAHRGLVALDFNNISSLTMRSQPNYDGLWTGLEVLQILTGEFGGVERCFMFALDADNKICLYELLPTASAQNFDWNGTEEVLTESWIISNALFGRETLPKNVTAPLKKLITAEIFLEQLAGNDEVEIDVKYNSDQWPFMIDWKTFEVCAPSVVCPVDCEQPQEVHRQYATYKRLPEPQDRDCNPLTKREQRSGYSFQIRLQWTGRARLEKMIVWSLLKAETIENVCPPGECVAVTGCGEDYFSYQIESD